MKTAISIPEGVFSKAEDFARSRKITRSKLFTVAVAEYIRHHRKENVTKELNEIYPKETSTLDPVLGKLQALSIPGEKW